MSAQFCLQRARRSSASTNLDSDLLRIFARSLGPEAPPEQSRRAEPQGAQAASACGPTRGEVAFVATGIGMKRAQGDRAPGACRPARNQLVIGTGVVGALSGGLRPGDIVIADRTMRARADSAHPEHVVPVDAVTLEYCERTLHAAGLASSTGAILSSPRVIPNAAGKRAAKQHSGAIAVDMESVAIAARRPRAAFRLRSCAP